jgi:hypothetical protein
MKASMSEEDEFGNAPVCVTWAVQRVQTTTSPKAELEAAPCLFVVCLETLQLHFLADTKG